MAIRGRLGYHLRVKLLRGDPGLFGSIGKLAGKFAPKFLKAIPGVGTALSLASILPGAGSALKSVAGIAGRVTAAGGRGAMVSPGLGAARGITAGKALTLAGGGAAAVGGASGLYGLYKNQLEQQGVPSGTAAAHARAMTGHRRRRMNPGNARAARRAIRRIKSVRKLLHSIEAQLPKRRSSAPAPMYAFQRRRRKAA
jgi:hypothetical protein